MPSRIQQRINSLSSIQKLCTFYEENKQKFIPQLAQLFNLAWKVASLKDGAGCKGRYLTKYSVFGEKTNQG